MSWVLITVAAFLGGAINSVAGGGSFLTFPALVFAGSAPLAANATSTVALWPGAVASAWGYRDEVRTERALVLRLGVISAVGGLIGALAVIATPQQTFTRLLPWLLLAATLVFTFGDALRKRFVGEQRSMWVIGALQLVVAIYGGYFGGGMGLMMLALFSLLGARELAVLNGLKSVLGAAINATALAAFVLTGQVDWPRALVMICAAAAGGYLGARVARRIASGRVKLVVIATGWLMTVVFFLR